MTHPPESNASYLLPVEPDDTSVPGDGRRAMSPTRGPRRTLPVVLALLAGLLVGWLGIGWWLWPVEWANSAPWQLKPEFQKTYLALVAHEYARTSDLARVETLLAGWDRVELARLLAALQGKTDDPETRQHVAVLAGALQLLGADTSLATSLLGRQGFVLGAAIAAIPLLAAIVLAITAFARRREGLGNSPEADETAEPSLEELLADVLIDDEPTTAEPSPDSQETKPQKSAGAQEWLDKPEEAPPDQADEEEPAEAEGELGDLADLFEVEDTTLADLEAFCKNMLEIGIDELSVTTGVVLRDLEAVNRLRPEPVHEPFPEA